MNDQNLSRLSRMVARWGRERAEIEQRDRDGLQEKQAAFLAELEGTYASVLRPVIDDIGAELRQAGHDCRIEERVEDGVPRFDLYVVIQGRRGSKDLIQFLVWTHPEHGYQLVVELVLRSAPFELRRFHKPSELTADIAEQMIVEAIEQFFASPPR
jgi:hypothetical protein